MEEHLMPYIYIPGADEQGDYPEAIRKALAGAPEIRAKILELAEAKGLSADTREDLARKVPGGVTLVAIPNNPGYAKVVPSSESGA
jgi:hypothetical protein